jgi:hypothetical protein
MMLPKHALSLLEIVGMSAKTGQAYAAMTSKAHEVLSRARLDEKKPARPQAPSSTRKK